MTGYAPKGFLDILDGLWWNIDRHLTNDLTYLSACDVRGMYQKRRDDDFDHHARLRRNQGQLVCIGQAAKEMGVRSCLCYEVSDRDGSIRRGSGLGK